MYASRMEVWSTPRMSMLGASHPSPPSVEPTMYTDDATSETFCKPSLLQPTSGSVSRQW